MRHLDLFSGIGGFALGLERAGFETVAFCEIEDYPRQVLHRHWPDVPIYEDVRHVTKARLESDGITDIGIITGGFPCQDISVAGKQKGIHAERSGLWTELCRIIGDIRPRYAIIENVTALISGKSDEPYPNDRCVCGWPYRWGGLHIHSEQQKDEHLCGETRHRDDNESRGNFYGTGEDRREYQDDKEGNKEVGSSEMLDSLWSGGSQHSPLGLSAHDIEKATSRILLRATKDAGWSGKSPERQCEMDGRGEGGGGNNKTGSCFAEREGASDAGTGCCCEACGRPVVYESSRLRRTKWFNRVLGDLAEIGYGCEWHCIPASELGAHHHRDRVWVICYPKHAGRDAAEVREGDQAGNGSNTQGQESTGEPARPGDADVANTHSSGLEKYGVQFADVFERSSPSNASDKQKKGDGNKDVADTDNPRLQGRQRAILQKRAIERFVGSGSCRGDGIWITEPDLGRVANGIPRRVDRLKGLGNAVVPQIPELIGRAIMEAEK